VDEETSPSTASGRSPGQDLQTMLHDIYFQALSSLTSVAGMAAESARTFLPCALPVAVLCVRQLAPASVQDYLYPVSCCLLGAENSFAINPLFSSPPSAFL
jgi:hypothetical protein